MIHEKIYNSALKDTYLDDQQNQMIMQLTIPELTVFQSMLAIMKVNDKKIADNARKAKEKAQRQNNELSEQSDES